MAEGIVDLTVLVSRLSDRSSARTEADVQSDLKTLLLYGGFNLDEGDVRLEGQAGNRRRIDVEVGRTVFEVKKDLRVGKTLDDAVEQLASYVLRRTVVMGERYVGVITDGASWRLFHPIREGGLKEVSSFQVERHAPDVRGLVVWLDGSLATLQDLAPTPSEIAIRLGAGSVAHALDRQTLQETYEQSRNLPSVKLKRELWARLLTKALGTRFQDEDALFVEHTYLVLIAELIAHAVVGFDIEDPTLSAYALVSGEMFAMAEIGGVVERDFFDWVVETPSGASFLKTLAKRIARFQWGGVQHDVLKVLYESVIDAETRHVLGEYYTPDWLASMMVEDMISEPLKQRVLDPSCGSGTFLFHAVRSYLAAAECEGISNKEALDGACEHVIGVDLHPVAVTLARVTYLLAIGPERLKLERGSLSLPVYLGDSLQWQTDDGLFSGGGISIYTRDGAELYDRELHFPARVLADVTRFDQLVEELASKASDRPVGSKIPSLKETFNRYGVHPNDQSAVRTTFENMCRLYDDGRNHIWGYYVRNLARPHWLSLKENRVDVLIGNPPWLSYRFMTLEMQSRFKDRSRESGLWVGAQLTAHQDLSAFFVAQCAGLYLKEGGRLGFVMPIGTLTRQQYRGFRTGDWSSTTREVKVKFSEPWDLSKVRVKPALFPIPCCVISARLSDEAEAVGENSILWLGTLPARDIDWPTAANHLVRQALNPIPDMEAPGSIYRGRFTQGAFVWPRVLLLVNSGEPGPLGMPSGRTRVESARSRLEKPPWRDLPTLDGSVETQFIRPLCLGSTLVPFRILTMEQALIPWDSGRLIHDVDDLDRFPGLSSWWRSAQLLWEQYRPDYTTDDLWERLDYKGGTSKQFPIAPRRVVYTSSGSRLVAARLLDGRALVSETLYWATCASDAESHYLTAILNSGALLRRIRHLQAEGQFGTRHFHKVVFAERFPLFDPTDELMSTIAGLGLKGEALASKVEIEGRGFSQSRQIVAQALAESGTSREIDESVDELLRLQGRDLIA
jgi:SAM-dependent methyltransferase